MSHKFLSTNSVNRNCSSYTYQNFSPSSRITLHHPDTRPSHPSQRWCTVWICSAINKIWTSKKTHVKHLLHINLGQLCNLVIIWTGEAGVASILPMLWDALTTTPLARFGKYVPQHFQAFPFRPCSVLPKPSALCNGSACGMAKTICRSEVPASAKGKLQHPRVFVCFFFRTTTGLMNGFNWLLCI